MKIEWASHFHPDGRRRTPPPSAMHGWLAKMRGTLIGNEDLRSKGIREMKAAKAERKRRTSKKQKQYSAHSESSIFSFLGLGKGKKQSKANQRLQSRKRPGGGSTRPSQASKSPAIRPTRPPIRSSVTSPRNSHRGHRQGFSRSQPHSYSGVHSRQSGRR